MNKATSARWDFLRAPNQRFLQLHLVAGGHPDRWWVMLAAWRVAIPGTPPPSTYSPGAPVVKLKEPAPITPWAETVLSAVLAHTVPTKGDADVGDDATVRGKLMEPFLDHDVLQLQTDWVYTVTDSPTAVVAEHTLSGERRSLETASAAWGVLKAHAKATGDTAEVARIEAEELITGLRGS